MPRHVCLCMHTNTQIISHLCRLLNTRSTPGSHVMMYLDLTLPRILVFFTTLLWLRPCSHGHSPQRLSYCTKVTRSEAKQQLSRNFLVKMQGDQWTSLVFNSRTIVFLSSLLQSKGKTVKWGRGHLPGTSLTQPKLKLNELPYLSLSVCVYVPRVPNNSYQQHCLIAKSWVFSFLVTSLLRETLHLCWTLAKDAVVYLSLLLSCFQSAPPLSFYNIKMSLLSLQ